MKTLSTLLVGFALLGALNANAQSISTRSSTYTTANANAANKLPLGYKTASPCDKRLGDKPGISVTGHAHRVNINENTKR